MCGAVSFRASEVPDEYGVCHCEMCRRWTGSALLGITIPTDKLDWNGSENIATIQSSTWAERGWCVKCGTGLFFRVTMDGKYSGGTEIPIGLLDDQTDLTMSNEIFIDHKPDSFAFAGEDRKLMTRQDCVEKFGVLDSE
jgi:hypothetical protein